MNKTFFENLGDIAEQGQVIEQKIRLCVAAKAGYEELPFRSEIIKQKISVHDRYERILKVGLNRFKNEIINSLKNK